MESNSTDDAIDQLAAEMEKGDVQKPELPDFTPDVEEAISSIEMPEEVEVASEEEVPTEQPDPLMSLKVEYERQLAHFKHENAKLENQVRGAPEAPKQFDPLEGMPDLPPEYEDDPRFTFLKDQFIAEARKGHALEERLNQIEHSTRNTELRGRAMQLSKEADGLSNQFHYADPETILAKYHALGGQKTLKAIAKDTHNNIVRRVKARRGKKSPPTAVTSTTSAPTKTDSKGLAEVFGDQKDWKSGRNYLLKKYGIK